MNTLMIQHEDSLKSLAMAIARNKAGADEPVHTVLLREGVTPAEYLLYQKDVVFQRYVLAYTKEMEENGVSFAKRQAPVCRARQVGQDDWARRSALHGRARHPAVAKCDSSAGGVSLNADGDCRAPPYRAARSGPKCRCYCNNIVDKCLLIATYLHHEPQFPFNT